MKVCWGLPLLCMGFALCWGLLWRHRACLYFYNRTSCAIAAIIPEQSNPMLGFFIISIFLVYLALFWDKWSIQIPKMSRRISMRPNNRFSISHMHCQRWVRMSELWPHLYCFKISIHGVYSCIFQERYCILILEKYQWTSCRPDNSYLISHIQSDMTENVCYEQWRHMMKWPLASD